MFRKLFGPKAGGGGGRRRKRLSPSATTSEGLMQAHPMFEYAMKEYAQTVPSQAQNEDGRVRPAFSMGPTDEEDGNAVGGPTTTQPATAEAAAAAAAETTREEGRGEDHRQQQHQQQQHQQQQQQQQSQLPNPSLGGDNTGQGQGGGGGTVPASRLQPILRATSYRSAAEGGGRGRAPGDLGAASMLSRESSNTTNLSYTARPVLSPRADYGLSDEESQYHRQEQAFPGIQRQQSSSLSDVGTTSSRRRPTGNDGPGHRRQAHPPPSQQQQQPRYGPAVASPDTTYVETYGDAYIGGPMRYVYPSGYQSMRPRSGPWKLSIIVCLIFTWLSVFVIGYCSDQAAGSSSSTSSSSSSSSSSSYAYGYDDDKLAIETKWCGSRLLYWMWVVSMLITGMATAYCSVIGYIKLRDFAVANSRMQPTGPTGKSDYYVQLYDHQHPYGGGGDDQARRPSDGQPVHPANYSQTIYQADGSPQFWGSHIYRPTQAAVMTTSR